MPASRHSARKLFHERLTAGARHDAATPILDIDKALERLAEMRATAAQVRVI